MKKFLSFVFIFIFMSVLTACSVKDSAKEGIAPYELSEDGKYVLDAFGMSDTSQIISIHAPKEAISLHTNVYRLSDNSTWDVIGGGSISIGSEREPIEQLNGSFTMQLKDDYTIDFNLNFAGRCSFTSDPIELEKEFVASSIGFLQEFQPIELNTEIPVAIMVYDSDYSMPAYSPQDYFEPSKFEGMDLVQIVTLEFSDKTL